MTTSTVLQRKKVIYGLLQNKEIKRIVLYGELGVGKTWTAREISTLAKKRGLFNVVLWVFMSRDNDKGTLRDSIAYQLSLRSTSGGAEIEDINEESENDENKPDLLQQISSDLEGKKLLLVLDGEGDKMTEEELMPELESFMNLKQQSYKVLITTRNNMNINDDESVEVKPLPDKESISVLQERAGDLVFGIQGVKELAEAHIAKAEGYPLAIMFMAKAFSFFGKHVSGLQMLESLLKKATDRKSYNLLWLLHGGYNLLPHNILMDCFWADSHFFHGRWRIHYNELIAYWMMEGYLGKISSLNVAYQRGHEILMELVDCEVLKRVETDYVMMKGKELDLDDYLLEMSMLNLTKCYRLGYRGTATMGLANVLDDNDWEGLGRIILKDDVIKTVHSAKGQRLSTLLLDGSSLGGEFPFGFSESHQGLQVLAIFNPIRMSSLFSSTMQDLCVLVLRSCHFLEKLDDILNFQKLTAIEISGPSSLSKLPDEFFKLTCQLQSLNLSSLLIDSLPLSLYDLTELSWLIVRDCSNLKTIGSLRKLKKLLVLDLSGSSSLESIQDKNLVHNQELRILNLSKTKIKTLPLLSSLKKLTHLLLSECGELDRLRGIGSVKTLQILDLSNSIKFKEFHDQSLDGILDLKILDVSGTSLDRLPSNVSNPRHLYVNGCTNMLKSEYLSCIETLKDVEVLNLTKSQVKALPSVSHLHKLRQLSLSCSSNLEKLPGLKSLESLEVLDLSGCTALTSLDEDSFEKMSHISKLDLSETKIEILPSVSNLSNLRYLLLKKCTHLTKLPPLESLSKLEELNLKGLNFPSETSTDFLKCMTFLQILDLSETRVERLPSMSGLKNLKQLLLRDCFALKDVPDLQELVKLEVLDLSQTAVSQLPCLKNLCCLRKLLLRGCSYLSEFQKFEMLNVLGGSIKELPYGISNLTSLEQLVLPSFKDAQRVGSGKTAPLNRCAWDISSLPAETVERHNNPPISVSGSQFLQHLESDKSMLEVNFKKFHLLLLPIEEDGKDPVSLHRDDIMFRDIYLKTRQFDAFEEKNLVTDIRGEEKGSLEIRGFNHCPKEIENVLGQTRCLFLIDNAFEKWLSDLDASSLKFLKGCWLERCAKLRSVFHNEKAEEISKLDGLEFLWVSNSVNLRCLCSGKLQRSTFQDLSHLYLDCCPQLTSIFSSSLLPSNLCVLQIKFCDKLETVFSEASQEQKMPNLHTLCLWELPELKIVGCALPPRLIPKVWQCPKLLELEENVNFRKR